MAAAAITPAAAPPMASPPSAKIFAELPPLELQGVSWEAFQEQSLSLFVLGDGLSGRIQDRKDQNEVSKETG